MLIRENRPGQCSIATRGVLAVLGAALLLQPLPAAEERAKETEKEPVTRLLGRIFDADGKSALKDAVVHVVHLSTEARFTSAPTGAKGEFLFEDVPFGYYDLAVETAAGLFVSSEVINVPPGGKAVVNLAVTTFDEGAVQAQGRGFPGDDQDPAGVAVVSSKLTGRDFWRSPRGVAIVVGAGAVALIGFAGGSSSNVASPSNP